MIFPILAAVGASLGWATGIVLARKPAHDLGAFEFTRIQLLACSGILAFLCSVFGYWNSVNASDWLSYLMSTLLGIILGNLAMIECLRRGGPRRTELLLSLKAPLVVIMAYFWFRELPSATDFLGTMIVLSGIGIAILFGTNEHSQSDKTIGSMIIIVLLGVTATAFQGFGFLIMKPVMQAGTEPLAVSAIRLLGAAFLISLIALLPIETFRPHGRLTPALLGRTILPGFIGYGISSTLLLYAFANMDAGIAAILGSLSPVLVLPVLWVNEGIAPTRAAAAGAVLAIAGITLIVLF